MLHLKPPGEDEPVFFPKAWDKDIPCGYLMKVARDQRLQDARGLKIIVCGEGCASLKG